MSALKLCTSRSRSANIESIMCTHSRQNWIIARWDSLSEKYFFRQKYVWQRSMTCASVLSRRPNDLFTNVNYNFIQVHNQFATFVTCHPIPMIAVYFSSLFKAPVIFLCLLFVLEISSDYMSPKNLHETLASSTRLRSVQFMLCYSSMEIP